MNSKRACVSAICSSLTACGSGDNDDGRYKTININGRIRLAENPHNDSADHFSVNGDGKNDDKYGYPHTGENTLKACPTGWYLPAKEERGLLLKRAAITGNSSEALRDKSWDNSLDSFGFAALPAGSMNQRLKLADNLHKFCGNITLYLRYICAYKLN